MSPFFPSVQRWHAIARIEVLQLLTDRPTLAIILVLPVLQIALFGYAVRSEPRDVTVAIARERAEPEGPLVHAITQTNLLRVLADGLSKGAATNLVVQHRALVGIEFPDWSSAADERAPGAIEIVIDGSDPGTAGPAVQSLELALLRRAVAIRFPSHPTVRVTRLYNPDGRTTWSTIPALAGAIVMISMLLLGALTVARERERGTWEGLLTTPASGLDAMLGKLSPYLLVGILQAVLVTLLGHGLFGFPLHGSFTLFVLAAALLALAHLVLGFTLSMFAQSQVQAIQAAVIFYLPSMLLSGFLFPFSGMPRWAQLLGQMLPLTHFVRLARGLLLRGDGLESVAPEVWPLLAFIGVVAVPAAWRFRVSAA